MPARRTVMAVVASGLLSAVPGAQAAQRTFVATGGTDASASCSLASPCRSFAKAITLTDADGEIIVLDSGGYGGVTVDRSVSITSPPGIYAGISVFAGPNNLGVDVSTPGVVVALRGLSINGQGGAIGINFTDGAELHVDGCTISNFVTHGIFATAGRLFVHDTLVRNNGNTGLYSHAAEAHFDRIGSRPTAAQGSSLARPRSSTCATR